jgi:hypothetical protein
MPQPFDSRAAYDRLVETLVATGSIREPTKRYWDVRPSVHFETLEFRVADSVMRVDEAVMVAGLARALAFTGHAAAVRRGPPARGAPARRAPGGRRRRDRGRDRRPGLSLARARVRGYRGRGPSAEAPRGARRTGLRGRLEWSATLRT